MSEWVMTASAAAKAALVGGALLCGSLAARGESEAPINTDPDRSAPGGGIYFERCASCHEQPTGRVPPRVTMLPLTPEYVERILTTGTMKVQAAGLTAEQIRLVSTFVTRKPFGESAEPDPNANLCKSSAPLRLTGHDWKSWGLDASNSRFQRHPGFKAEDVPRLKPKWVFAYPGRGTYAQPTVAGDRLFVPTVVGTVFALDAATGCTHWSFHADAGVKTAVVIGENEAAPSGFTAFFGDERGVVYAVDAGSGRLLWKTRVEEHPLTRVIGSPSYFEGRLFVPVASQEELGSRELSYACCTFRGSIVALDGATGKPAWKSYNIDEAPKPWTTPSGRQMFGPAGVAIWNAMAIDARKRLLYTGTGNSYAEMPTATANALMAVDLATGARRWVNQVQPNDNWTTGCWRPKNENCPASDGPDNDFASATLLHEFADGRRLVIGAQKSGHMYAVDPDANGKLVWRAEPSADDVSASQADNSLSGILYGMAADDRHVYAARTGKGGVTAMSLETGKEVWRTPSPNVGCAWGVVACTNAQGTAATLMPGVLFAGSDDGHIRAYEADDGRIVWDFDTAAQPYQAVNGTTATGGTIRNAAQIVANGMLYVNSGYIHPRSGNALIAFSVDGR
jgi:polyvinyl alcohol dehydrogenase (cytochrome)